ncbi:hypothetical protein M8J75_002310 [Diaphorina citri]|nr:hypothetical protein M8J75_002310 [Diaphorina citri]
MKDVHSVYHMDSDLCAVSRLQDITFPCEECKELCVLSKYCIKHKDCSKAMSTPAPSSESVCVEHSNLFPKCHSCQKCEESFDNCNNLWSHMFIKHENSDFVCNLCPPGSKVVVKRPSSLRKHMQDVHSVYHMDSDLCAVSRLQDITFPCEECKELCVLSKYCIKHKDCSKAMSTPAPSSESVCIEHEVSEGAVGSAVLSIKSKARGYDAIDIVMLKTSLAHILPATTHVFKSSITLSHLECFHRIGDLRKLYL